MSTKVIKLIIVTDDDTCGMIIDYDMLNTKERDRDEHSLVEFTFTDKHSISHRLNFVHAEEV